MKSNLLILRDLHRQSLAVPESVRDERRRRVHEVMSQMQEEDLYKEILLLKNANYGIEELFEILVSFQKLVRFAQLDGEMGLESPKVYPTWNVFVDFMNEVDAFSVKSIPIHEWEDLAIEALDTLIEILDQGVTDVFNSDRFENLTEKWSQRFSYLLNVKGYESLKKFGPEY